MAPLRARFGIGAARRELRLGARCFLAECSARFFLAAEADINQKICSMSLTAEHFLACCASPDSLGSAACRPIIESFSTGRFWFAIQMPYRKSREPSPNADG